MGLGVTRDFFRSPCQRINLGPVGERPVSLMQLIRAIFSEMFPKPNFVKCACDICGGMVSTRENMVQGEQGWYCTTESRNRAEPMPHAAAA